MSQVEQARRELFEPWASQQYWMRGCDFARDCDGASYFWEPLESAWLGFNAALDALVIELPESEWLGAVDPEPGLNESKVRAAIESIGLGVKVK